MIASETGGNYHYVSLSSAKENVQHVLTSNTAGIAHTGLIPDNMFLDLNYRYRLIASEINGLQPFFSHIGPDFVDDGFGLVLHTFSLNSLGHG